MFAFFIFLFFKLVRSNISIYKGKSIEKKISTFLHKKSFYLYLKTGFLFIKQANTPWIIFFSRFLSFSER